MDTKAKKRVYIYSIEAMIKFNWREANFLTEEMSVVTRMHNLHEWNFLVFENVFDALNKLDFHFTSLCSFTAMLYFLSDSIDDISTNSVTFLYVFIMASDKSTNAFSILFEFPYSVYILYLHIERFCNVYSAKRK